MPLPAGFAVIGILSERGVGGGCASRRVLQLNRVASGSTNCFSVYMSSTRAYGRVHIMHMTTKHEAKGRVFDSIACTRVRLDESGRAATHSRGATVSANNRSVGSDCCNLERLNA
jgi:hypothetical protein